MYHHTTSCTSSNIDLYNTLYLQLHQNFIFILFQTDLCGIKWRKLVWGESNFSPEPLEDPVLSSFSRCLAGDILCVWRRVGAAQQPASAGGGLFEPIGLPQPTGPTHPPLSLQAAKELWIFWYGEEPDLSGLVTPELLSSGELLQLTSYVCPCLCFYFLLLSKILRFNIKFSMFKEDIYTIMISV